MKKLAKNRKTFACPIHQQEVVSEGEDPFNLYTALLVEGWKYEMTIANIVLEYI
jgi:hypothetical protein